VLGLVSIICSAFSLDAVIDALISTRILVQFIGQIFALILLRKHAPDMPRPYRMWLYPLPSIIALVGWLFIFATTPWPVIALGLGTLVLGAICFLVWSWFTDRWPFGTASADAGV
jgi:amino acid transporter